MIGVYKIKCLLSGQCYIGSSKEISERWHRHKKDLRKGRHHSIILQRAWDKYGEYTFVFGIVEICEEMNLTEKENYYFKVFKPRYNICPVADSRLGKKVSEETKAKHRAYAIANNVKPPAITYEQKRKGVVMLDYMTNEDLKTFISLSEACRYIGKTHLFVSTISAVCNGDRKSAFGYKWRFNTTQE